MDWRNYLPEPETQIVLGVDSMECTAHATIDAIQILLCHQYQDFTDYDESFTSYLSGTTNEGNNPQWVAKCIGRYGLYPREAHLQGGLEIPQNVKRARARQWLLKYDFSFKEIKQDQLTKWLSVSPIGVALDAWVEEEEGIFITVGAKANHWTLIVYEDAEFYYCWDSIAPHLKRLRKPWKFGYCMRYAVRRRQSNWIGDILMGIWQIITTQRKQGEKLNSKLNTFKR